MTLAIIYELTPHSTPYLKVLNISRLIAIDTKMTSNPLTSNGFPIQLLDVSRLNMIVNSKYLFWIFDSN